MWYYNNVGITVVDLKEEDNQIIAELQPIASGTIYQIFGYQNQVVQLQCLVVGVEDKNTLQAMKDDGEAHPLSGAGVYFGEYLLQKISIQWQNSYRQTFRSDKDPYDYVFKCSLELKKE